MIDQAPFAPIEARWGCKIDLFQEQLPHRVIHVPFAQLNQGTLHLRDAMHRYVCQNVFPESSEDGLMHRGGLVIATIDYDPAPTVEDHRFLASLMGYKTSAEPPVYLSFGGVLMVNDGQIVNLPLPMSVNLPCPFPFEKHSQSAGRALQLALEISQLTGVCLVT